MSLFKKKPSSNETPPAETGVLGTGGNIDGIVGGLIKHAHDQDEDVRDTIANSLLDIGRNQPNLVLSACNDFLAKNPRLDKGHRVILLTTIKRILDERKDQVEDALGYSIVTTAFRELTMEKEVVPDWQTAASSVLVSIGEVRSQHVTQELLERFQPGSVPHYFIMKTLGDHVSANAVHCVPRLKEILARVLPVLGGIKHANIIWVFAAGLGHFCEAILTYCANVKDDPNINSSSFSSEMFPAYEVMFARWLTSGEQKVRLASVQALGAMCAVIDRATYDANILKLIPVTLALYKKEKPEDHLPITTGLFTMLDVGTRNGNFVLEPMLQNVMNTLMPLICSPIDERNNKSIKNHNEMLRCMEAITRGFPEVLIAFLLTKLEQKDPKQRIGALDIIKHIVTRLVKDELLNKKSLLVSGVKPVAQNETDNSVKKALAQVVIAMASHSYLGLEGGEYLVEFVVRTSGLQDQPQDPKKKGPEPEVSVGELRLICDNILNLMTTTIADMIPVLWPYLFETLVDPKFVESTAVVCKNLNHIATIKRETEAPDYLIDFDRAVNLPKPSQIIARLFVQLNQPHRRGQLGSRILSLLQSIGPILHPSISDMWDTTLPKLVAYLEANPEGPSWSGQKWEDLVLRLLSETIKVANDDQWTMNLGTAYAEQLDYYVALPDLKRLCLKHLGMVLQKSAHKEFIRSGLDRMMSCVNHGDELERDGCAQGFGYCSNTHLDIVLEKLQTTLKGPATGGEKKGLFSFGGSKKTASTGNNKLTVILAFGYVAAYANPAVITSRIDIHVWQHIKPLVEGMKTPLDKAVALRTMNLIAEAMHPSRLGQRFVFRQRDEILTIVHNFVRGDPVKEMDDVVRARGVQAAANLAKLEPPLTPDVETAVLGTLIQYFGLPESDSKESKEIQEGLLELFTSVLFSAPGVETLIRLIVHLEKWSPQPEHIRRRRATATLIHLVTELIEATVKGLKDNFDQVGSALSILVPRCTDPQPEIRQSAVEGVAKILYLDHLLKNKSNPEETPMPDAIQPLKELRDGLLAPELNKQFGLIHGMAQVLSKLLPVTELSNLLNGCIRGLADSQTSSTAGVCVVINGVIKLRGAELKSYVGELVRGFVKAMPGIKHDQTMNGTLHAVRSLAVHHLIPVVNELLLAPQPHSPELIKAFQVLAKDENLVLDFLEHLLDIVNNSQLYDEEPMDPAGKGPLVRVPVARAMSATAAIGEIMPIEEMQDVISEHYPRIAGTLLLRFGTTVGCVPKKMSLVTEEIAVEEEVVDPKAKKKAPPKPKVAPAGPTIDSTEQAYTSLTSFVTCSKDRRLGETLIRERANFNTEATWVSGLTNIAATVCKTQADEMRGIFGFLLPYVKGNYVGQKIAAAAILAEFVNHCNGDFELLDKLISTLLGALVDPPIKIHALRGLGNITSNGKDQANKYAPTVLDALISSIDDISEDIAMESMNGLSKVFEIVEVERVAPILVNICHRIRPAFEKRHNAIRAAAFQLFGNLWRFGAGVSADSFYEQIHSNMPALIVHLQEEDQKVVQACKGAMRKLAPLFRSPALTAYFQHGRFDENRSIEYEEFLNDFSKLLIEFYPERVNYYVMKGIEYYKSEWMIVRGNAASWTGYCMGNLPEDKRRGSNLNPAIISKALLNLLLEPTPLVRKRAAEAMAHLHTY